MNNMKTLEIMLDRLVIRRKDLARELELLPEGMLYASQRNGIWYYYQRIPKGGNHKKEHRVGITGDVELVMALVRKRYVTTALDLLEKDIRTVETALQKYVPCDENSVMSDFVAEHPELASGIYYGRANPETWGKYSFGETFYEEDLRAVSGKGMRMRSAGEVYIESRLRHFGIPYRYEEPLPDPDVGSVPDFTLMRPSDRKIMYWEHFGMVNNEAYVWNNLDKVGRYIEYGIVPWDNLIMTFNTKEGSINAKLIDSMIEAWLL